MVLPRPSMLRSALWAQTRRAAGVGGRSTFRQQLGRRSYASDHGHAKPSSDIPWMIGSVVVTVPCAWYLLQQGPVKTEHHGHDAHHEESHEEEAEPAKDEEPAKESKSEGEGEAASESGDEAPKDTPETSDDEGGKDDTKGDEPATDAKHPSNPSDDPEKSKKGEESE